MNPRAHTSSYQRRSKAFVSSVDIASSRRRTLLVSTFHVRATIAAMGALTRQEVEVLQRALESLKDELRDMLALSLESARPVDLDKPIGRISRVDALQLQSMARASRSQAQLRARQVASALERVDEADYGTCLECGEDIGFARLEAKPEAPLCIGCQGARERR